MTQRLRPTTLFLTCWILTSSLLLVAAKSYRKRKDDNPHSRSARFVNRSGAKVDFSWVHPSTGELAHSHTNGEGTFVRARLHCLTALPLVGKDSSLTSNFFGLTGIVWGSETGINTYVGHEFEVIEISVVQGIERCLKKNRCRRTRFVVNENEDQGMFV